MLFPRHGEEEKRKRLESGVACGSQWAGGRVVWGKGRTHSSGDASRGDALLLMGRAHVRSTVRQHGWQGGQIPHCTAAIVLISEQALVFSLLTGKRVDLAVFCRGGIAGTKSTKQLHQSRVVLQGSLTPPWP